VNHKTGVGLRCVAMGFVLVFIVGLIALAVILSSSNDKENTKVEPTELVAAATTIQEFNI